MEKKLLVVIVVVVLIAAGVGGYFAYRVIHPAKTNLPTLYLTACAPLSALDEYQLGVMVNDYKAIGISAGIKLVSSTIEASWSTPNSTPQFVDTSWTTDPPDPILFEFYSFTSYANGGEFGANYAWTTNHTLNSSIVMTTAFNSNKAQQMQEVVNLYHTFYDQYNYVWLSNPDTFFFVQPYINNFTYNPFENYYYNMMSYNMSYNEQGVKAPTSSNLTDVADGGSIGSPDFLDPSTGFLVVDVPMFTALYQELYEFDGPNYSKLVPVLANGAPSTPPGGVYDQNYNITLRSGIYFNNSDPVNASTVWFSYYRTIVMAQGPSVDDYGGILYNSSAYAATAPYSIPAGWLHDVRSAYNATHKAYLKLPYPTNYSNLNVSNTVFAANLLASMLSHYDPWTNTTQAKLLEYPNQAVAVPDFAKGSSTLKLNINLLNPYPLFFSDTASQWGNIADPMFIDGHDGVIATLSNNYTDVNGMPGTGPYHIVSVGAALDSLVMEKVTNYWGNKYWNTTTGKGIDGFPAVAQPAHIYTVLINYAIDHSGRISGFLDNDYQISRVSSSYLGSIMNVAPYDRLPLTSYWHKMGAVPSVSFISMNNHKFPTNILDFREAIWYAINQTAMNYPFYYTFSNGSKVYLAQNYIGPISPGFTNFYNNATKGLAPETYNIAMAEHYLNLAGIQGKFYVTLPNGTKLGDTSLAPSAITIFSQTMLSVSLLAQNMMMAVVKTF